MQASLLADIGKAVLGAAALGLPASLLQLPLLLAYVAAGVALGPHLGIGAIRSAESIAALSEIGLVLLMFILGLEIDLRKLGQAGRPVLVNGVTQFVGCLALGAGLFGALGFRGDDLVYLAVACSLSSTLVVVKILVDRMDLQTLPSRITLGVLVIQDLWVIAFLSVQPNLSHLDAKPLLFSAGKVALLVASSWAVAKYVLPRVFERAGRHPELMLIVAMAWCFGACGAADALSLSVEMGALIAGIALASLPYHVDVAAKVSSLRDFFVTLFFVSLGLQVPRPTWTVVSLAAAIIGFTLVSRVLTLFPVLHHMGYANRTSLLPALNLSQLSEFALVLCGLGVAFGHIGKDLLSAMTLAMVVSALLSSAIIPGAHRIYRAVAPVLVALGFRDPVNEIETGSDEAAAEPPQIVLLGFFRVASSLLEEIRTRHPDRPLGRIRVVDFNPETHRRLRKLGVPCVYGDISHPDTLRHVGIEGAHAILCTIPDSQLKGTKNLRLLRQLRRLAPLAKVVVTAETLDTAREMYAAGADFVFLPRLESAQHLADVLDRIDDDGGRTVRESAIAQLADRTEVLA